MSDSKIKALEALMPLGGWNYNEGTDTVTLGDDGVAFGYKIPTKATIDAKVAEIEHNEPLLAQLAVLDAVVPRAVEDLVIAANTDSFLVGKANEKKVLRSQLQFA